MGLCCCSQLLLSISHLCCFVGCGRQFVHRDLAARNVLVHQEADGTLVAKVTDFGLSRYVIAWYYLCPHFTAMVSLLLAAGAVLAPVRG